MRALQYFQSIYICCESSAKTFSCKRSFDWVRRMPFKQLKNMAWHWHAMLACCLPKRNQQTKANKGVHEHGRK